MLQNQREMRHDTHQRVNTDHLDTRVVLFELLGNPCNGPTRARASN